jgi:hypothetical protein
MEQRPTGMRRVLGAATIVYFCLGSGVVLAQLSPQIPNPIGHRHKSAEQKQGSNQRPSIQAEGVVRSNDGKMMVVGSSDGRTFTIGLTDKTAFVRNGKTISSQSIVAGATVQVEAKPDDEDNLTAVRVELLKDPGPEAAQSNTEPGNPDHPDIPHVTIMKSPLDAPNRPILHRGPSERRTGPSSDDDDRAPTSSATNRAATEPDDGIIVEPDPPANAKVPAKTAPQDLIARTREWVNSFSSSLPNYVCQQSTTRYQEESKQTGWRALDIISAQVVYEDGKESYRDITVGGKKTSKSMLELGGSTSTGEFASTLRGVFSPASRASFKLYHTTRLGQSEAAIYDFKVDLPNSDWQIRVGGQMLRPAYSGSVWIDKNTAEVRRIEMQADKIPADFPLDAVEWAVDYDKVMLGANAFFLPVHAENLGCQRGTTICMKNTVDFRNYHKFAGESTIKFEK